MTEQPAKKSPKRPRELWHPPAYEDADIRAIQALALYAQTAVMPAEADNPVTPPSPAEVKRALDWIINAASATYDNGFIAGDAGGRVAAFMDGRQFVGQQIVKLMKLRPAIFDKSERA